MRTKGLMACLRALLKLCEVKNLSTVLVNQVATLERETEREREGGRERQERQERERERETERGSEREIRIS